MHTTYHVEILYDPRCSSVKCFPTAETALECVTALADLAQACGVPAALAHPIRVRRFPNGPAMLLTLGEARVALPDLAAALRAPDLPNFVL